MICKKICNSSYDELIKEKKRIIKKFDLLFSGRGQSLFEKLMDFKRMNMEKKKLESFVRSYIRIYKNNLDKSGVLPGSIIIEINWRCNKNCKKCFIEQKDLSMDDEILMEILNYANNRFRYIVISGGEPTLDPRIFTIAKKYKNSIFCVFANGSMIDEEYAEKLEKHPNILIMLSIDSRTKELSDQMKYDGAFDDVRNAINNLNKYNITWGYVSVVSTQNVKAVLSKSFIEEQRQRGARFCKYMEYFPFGRCGRSDWILSGSDLMYLNKRRKEIIEGMEIHSFDPLIQRSFPILCIDPRGKIRLGPYLNYSLSEQINGNVERLVEKAKREWASIPDIKECPVFSFYDELSSHLEKLGWEKINSYAVPKECTDIMRKNFLEFKKLKM